MRVGTRSVLFGAHQFLIHPWFVAYAWFKLYGFPWEPRLWIAFIVHDLGYIGKPNMDGPEGETHPILGARIMGFFFGERWAEFCLYHSRFMARKYNARHSQLCIADKLAVALEPWWFYLPRVILSGEIHEYMALAGGKNNSKYKGEPNDQYTRSQLAKGTYRGWFNACSNYLRQWVDEHKDGREDTWTQAV